MPSFRDQVNNARPAISNLPKGNKATRQDLEAAAQQIEQAVRQYILTESRKIPKTQKLRITGCVKCQLNREAPDNPNNDMTSVNRSNHNPFVDVKADAFRGGFFGLLRPPHSVHSFTMTAAGEQLRDMVRARLEPDGIRLGKWSVATNSYTAYTSEYDNSGYYPFTCGPEEECFPLPASVRRECGPGNQAKVKSGLTSRTVKARNNGHHLCLPFSFE